MTNNYIPNKPSEFSWLPLCIQRLSHPFFNHTTSQNIRYGSTTLVGLVILLGILLLQSTAICAANTETNQKRQNNHRKKAVVNPENSYSALTPKARLLFSKAVEYEKKKDFLKAVTFFELALDEDNRVLAFPDRGLVDKLILKYQAKVIGAGKNATTLRKLAYYTAVAKFDVEKSRFFYQELLREYPQSEEAKEAKEMLVNLDRIISSYKRELAREINRISSARQDIEEEEKRRQKAASTTSKPKKNSLAEKDKKEQQLKKKKEVIQQLEEQLAKKEEVLDHYRTYYYVRPDSSPYSKATVQARYFRYKREVESMKEKINNLKSELD